MARVIYNEGGEGILSYKIPSGVKLSSGAELKIVLDSKTTFAILERTVAANAYYLDTTTQEGTLVFSTVYFYNGDWTFDPVAGGHIVTKIIVLDKDGQYCESFTDVEAV